MFPAISPSISSLKPLLAAAPTVLWTKYLEVELGHCCSIGDCRVVPFRFIVSFRFILPFRFTVPFRFIVTFRFTAAFLFFVPFHPLDVSRSCFAFLRRLSCVLC